MVRIAHTADVHLATDAPERLAALRTVLDTAAERSADVVTIGGDLFDSAGAAEQLRPELRTEFDGLPFPILVIPGNHDAEVFRAERFFGADIRTLADEPYAVLDTEDVRFVGVPFTPTLDEPLIHELLERPDHDGPEVLLIHCSLDAPIDSNAGSEATPRYCPVRAPTLAELGFEYYLAGHYHTAHHTTLPTGVPFVYPGTPASITRSETGPRTIAWIDTEDPDPVRLESIETSRYERREVSVSPGQEPATIEEIESVIEQWDDPLVEAELTVTGLIEWSETAFADALPDSGTSIELVNRTRSVRSVTEHPLWEQFQVELEETDSMRTSSAAVEELVLSTMADLSAEGVVR